jgi:5'-3' exonuclease
MYIVSADKDFIQLLKHPNVFLIDPNTGKFRNQPGDKDYCEDIGYFMFLKCIRGDGGDNVPSAFPRVRETKIKKAYENLSDRLNFMNETWQLPIREGDELIHKTMVVGELFKENELLMDLEKQPDDIRKYMYEEIQMLVEKPKKYSNFKMMQFLGKHQLKNILDNLEKYIPLFSSGLSTRNAVTETPKANDDVISFE